MGGKRRSHTTHYGVARHERAIIVFPTEVTGPLHLVNQSLFTF